MKKQFTELIGVCFTLVLLLIGTSGAQAQYCNGSATSTADEYISNVTYGAFSNPSGINIASQVTDYTGLGSIGDISPGIAASFTIDIGTPFASDDVMIFLDLNQDGAFTSNELVGANYDGPVDGTSVVDVTVPGSALIGETQLRVMMYFAPGSPDDPCQVNTWGETEDYRINVVEGDCTPVDVTFTEVDDCLAETYDVSVVINDFGGNQSFTVYMTRSDDVEVLPVGYVNILPTGIPLEALYDIPFGVTVSAVIEPLAAPLCSANDTWQKVGECIPLNSECADATALDCNSVVNGSTTNATNPPAGTPFCGAAFDAVNSPGVWYTLTSDVDNSVNFNLSNSTIPFGYSEVIVYTGACGEFECVTGGYGDNASGQFNANADETYYILVGARFTGYSGDFTLTVDCEEITCEQPEVTIVAVDELDQPVEDCLPNLGEYGVAVTIEGGEGNDTFTVTVGDSTYTMAASETHIFRGSSSAFLSGSTTNVSVVGVDNPLCNNNSSANSASVAICPPENDLCENAIAITCGSAVSGSNIGATLKERCGAGGGRPGVWYSFTSEYNAFVSPETCISGTTFDTDFSLFVGDDCGNLTCYSGGSTDLSTEGYMDGGGCTQTTSSWSVGGAGAVFVAEAGETYYLLVHGFGATTFGDFELTIECEEILCDIPGVEVVAVDGEGAPIESCQDYNETYRAAVTLSGGAGNASFTVSIGDSSVVMMADETHIFGGVDADYAAGSTVNVSVVGDEDEDCNTSASVSTVVCAPANDLCADAIPVVCAGEYYGNTLGSTSVEDQEFCIVFEPSADNGGVWYSITVDATTALDIDLSYSGFNTKVYLYSGTCDALVCEDADDNSGDDATGIFGSSRLQTTVDPGTYYIYVSGSGTARGAFQMDINCQNLDCSPEMVASAADSEGNPIEGCADFGSDYYVMVTLTEGTTPENDFYNVSVNGSEPVQIAAGGSGLVGPVTVGTAANITAVGTTTFDCGASAFVGSPTQCVPANDMPCNAFAIPNDGTVTTHTNVLSTADEGEVVPPQAFCDIGWCETVVQGSVWFTFVAPESGRANISLCGPNSVGFDSQVAIYSVDGDCGDYANYTFVSANDDDVSDPICEFGGLISVTNSCLNAGETYYIQVDGWNGAQGNFDLTVTPIDGEVCDCVLPDYSNVFDDPDLFIFETYDDCSNEEGGMYGLYVTAPLDLGTQDHIRFVYDWTGNEGEPVEVLLTDEDYISPMTWSYDVTVTIEIIELSNPLCHDADESIYPQENISILVPTGNCDPDCLGIPGGTAQPGTPCEIDGAPGIYGPNTEGSCDCNLLPENDLCADAILIECGVEVTGNTVAASTTGNPTASCITTPSGPGVWYTFIGTGGEVVIDLCGSDFDTKLNVYTGSCGELVCVTGNDDNTADCDVDLNTSVVTFDSDSGVEYLVLLNSWNNNVGNFVMNISCEVVTTASLDGTIADWNVSCSDKDVTVNLFEVDTDTPAGSYAGIVNAAGEFTIADVLTGTYDVIVTVNGHLSVGVADVAIAVGQNAVAVGAVVPGDMDGNNGVNVVDFSQFNSAFGSAPGDENFLEEADMDCSGGVNVVDFSQFNASFGLSGVSAPLL